jgi:hypothetical protein
MSSASSPSSLKKATLMRHGGREEGHIQAGHRNPYFVSRISVAADNKSQYQRDPPLLFHHSPFIVSFSVQIFLRYPRPKPRLKSSKDRSSPQSFF